jgi:hypothetical protein
MVSKDFEQGTVPFTGTIPVVGQIEYRDALIAGAVIEASVSAPTPMAARPALMAMETPEDEPPGTYVLCIRNFPCLGMSNRSIQYALQSNQLDRILQEYKETVLGRRLQTNRRGDRFL